MDNELFQESSASVHYRPFIEQLSQIILSGEFVGFDSGSVIDGADAQAEFAVDKLVPYSIRSEMGIFFTPEKISVKCASIFKFHVESGRSFFDPACGSGNLLISIARMYEIKDNLLDTVIFWGEKFGGCDINQSFVHAAKLRIVALAAQRHDIPIISENDLSELLRHMVNFHVKDYLSGPVGGEFDCIIANPPFAHRSAPADLEWSAGKTQLAAIFLDVIIKSAKLNQKILAILPDVLRSGTRYRAWRRFVDSYSGETRVHVYGKFSSDVDVDVFMLEISISPRKYDFETVNWVKKRKIARTSKKIDDLFVVNIGPVVPHRLKAVASVVPFICAKTAPPFELVEAAAKVQFDGTLYYPPFVVVRRTSNPCDRQRIVSSVVIGVKPIAVENHLIIVRPLDGLVSTCVKLVEYLRGRSATQQVNTMIRCRHLTKGVVSSIVLPRGF